jgi:3-oxoadipate enol-lactonase
LTARSARIEHVACEVNYELSGPPGAPVVALPCSLGTDMSMWDPQLARLGTSVRVLRFDMRGHGASPVPPGPYSIADLGGDLLALLDRLEIERASLCGVSIGGMTSIWLAAHAPDRVDRLVVCCSSAYLDPEGSYRERATAVREHGIEPIADAALGRWFTQAYRDAHPDVVAHMREVLVSIAPEGYAGCCEALADMDLRADLGEVRAPTLVISGADDPATPPEHGRLIADGIAGSRFEVVADAAHLANIQQPDVVGELIERYLLL